MPPVFLRQWQHREEMVLEHEETPRADYLFASVTWKMILVSSRSPAKPIDCPALSLCHPRRDSNRWKCDLPSPKRAGLLTPGGRVFVFVVVMIYGSVCPAKNLCLFLLWNFPFLELQLGLGMCYRVYFPNKWTLPTLNSFRQTGLAAAFASRITGICIRKNRKYFDGNQCIPKVLPAFKSGSTEPSERLLLWINRWFPRQSSFPLSSRSYCRFPRSPWDHEDDFNEDAHAGDCGESWLLWAEL